MDFFYNFLREYPCDHYTSVIAVTLVMCGCPRVEMQTTALQLLQILDKRFFGTTSVLQGEKDKGMYLKSLKYLLQRPKLVDLNFFLRK